MGSYDCTISIGHLGEQLTLNQWVLGSSPRWCTKIKPLRRVPPWGLLFWLHARRTRTGRRHRSAGTNSPADCWLARGRVPGEREREQNVPGVEMLPLYSLTESVGLFFYCYNPGSRAGAEGDENSCEGDRRSRRKQGAVTGAARRNPMFAIISHL